MDNLGKMDKFLETYNLSKLIWKESENLIRPITTTDLKAVVKTNKQTKNSQQTKVWDQMASPNFTKHSKKN